MKGILMALKGNIEKHALFKIEYILSDPYSNLYTIDCI